MKVYSGFEEANWLWLILLYHAFPSARTITSVLFCHPYLPPWVLPCSQCCIPSRRNFPLCCKCLVSGPAPDLAPAAHCLGSLQVSKQTALASQPLSISLQVKLPFAYLATHLVNITLCFLLALQIPILAMLVFSFFFTYSILRFLPINLGEITWVCSSLNLGTLILHVQRQFSHWRQFSSCESFPVIECAKTILSSSVLELFVGFVSLTSFHLFLQGTLRLKLQIT